METSNQTKYADEKREASVTDMGVWFDSTRPQLVTEKGEPISFDKHQFLIDIYDDQSKNLVVMKAAQIGMSTLEIFKNIRDAQTHRMDIIYTLPSDADVGVFVGGKVNRILQNNPKTLLPLVADKDSVEQKQIGKSMIYFRGTWTKKSAIMVTADRLVHDEKDSSKQDVIADYQARLQHSKYKQTHVFSHPSTPNNGVDVEWQKSDQKEWFIKCPHCQHFQYLSWDIADPRKMSIDMELREFVCKKCHGILDWHARAKGQWIARKNKKNALWSGYHISLLMAPWVTAAEIVDKYNDLKQTIDYFYNKVLGLPYAGSGNSVLRDNILGNVTTERNSYQGRLIIGVDTGIKLRYVIGNKQGLTQYGEVEHYVPDEVLGVPLDKTLEYFLKKFENAVMVIDQGGDIIGSRLLQKKYPGRVFLCHYNQDRKTQQLIRWGEKDEYGNVMVDRNRTIQLVLDLFRKHRIKLYNGTEADWYDYWMHFSHIYRTKEEDNLGIERYKWERNDRDDWVHATVYWYAGIDRFGGTGAVVMPSLMNDEITRYPNIEPDNTVQFDPNKTFKNAVEKSLDANDQDEGDWRNS